MRFSHVNYCMDLVKFLVSEGEKQLLEEEQKYFKEQK